VCGIMRVMRYTIVTDKIKGSKDITLERLQIDIIGWQYFGKVAFCSMLNRGTVAAVWPL